MNSSINDVPVVIIPLVRGGVYFHGEVWSECPYCGEEHQMIGKPYEYIEDGWKVYRCKCGKLFKDLKDR